MKTITKVQLIRGGNMVLFARMAKRRYGLNVTRSVYYVVGEGQSAQAFKYYKEGLAEIRAEDQRKFYSTSRGMMMGGVTYNRNLK